MSGFGRSSTVTAPQLKHRLAAWIRERLAEARARGVVVGMSGGVDSSVAAVLCKLACSDATLGVLMPCGGVPADMEDARAVAAAFGIRTVTVDLQPAYDALVRSLAEAGQYSAQARLALGNIKPRLRMATLYYLANHLCYLVVGTGNRSELVMGYFTKYGDGGVDLLPLGNLTKGQVRELAVYLGIPGRIVWKAPSAGLWAGQTDEAELGITYQEIDAYLIGRKVPDAAAARIEAAQKATAHKRATPRVAGPFSW